jgi:hypothetical protein
MGVAGFLTLYRHCGKPTVGQGGCEVAQRDHVQVLWLGPGHPKPPENPAKPELGVGYLDEYVAARQNNLRCGVQLIERFRVCSR